MAQRCRDLTNGRGVTAVFDGVGRTMSSSYAALGPDGTLVLYGLTSFLRRGRRDLRGMLTTGVSGGAALIRSLLPGDRRRVRIYSVQRLAAGHAEWFRSDLATVLEMLADGRLEPFDPHVIAPQQIERALADLASGVTIGKQVLVPGVEAPR